MNFIPGKYDESYMQYMDFSVLEKYGKVCAFSIFIHLSFSVKLIDYAGLVWKRIFLDITMGEK
jgi:hypothetical protein